MTFKGNRIRTAAVFAAVVLFVQSMSGCSALRPSDGVGRDSSTQTSADTRDTQAGGNPETTEGTTHATSEKPVETTAPAPVERRASVLAVGDNIIHEAVYYRREKPRGGRRGI